MKKIIACVLMVVIAVATLCVFVGCTNKDEEAVPAITGITAKVASDANYKVGSAFDSKYITVTASLDNKTTKVVSTTAAISYDLSDIKLDADGNFTEEGEFTMDVTYSDWTTQVKVKVKAA
ncbi:MAG: hypothetical protein IJ033_05570 [Clostridia bacterium]|nr:hypothetical protein [Clostridia bacterium]